MTLEVCFQGKDYPFHMPHVANPRFSGISGEAGRCKCWESLEKALQKRWGTIWVSGERHYIRIRQLYLCSPQTGNNPNGPNHGILLSNKKE